MSPFNSRQWYVSLREWMLLRGDRRVIVGIVLLGIFGLFFISLVLGLIDVRERGPITRAFSSLIAGNFTLITIIISINQLIISREFGTPDELRERIDNILAYRHETEALAETGASPITPDQFLEFLTKTAADFGRRLRETVPESRNDGVQTKITEYSDTLIEHSNRTRTVLEGTESWTIETVLLLFNLDLEEELHDARQIRKAHREELPDESVATLDDIIELLEFIGIARQYFKTLYLQRELAELSRLLFYVGIPAVVASIMANWLFAQEALITGWVFRIIILCLTIISLAPLTILFAYIIRAATIAKRTATVMPFTVEEGDVL